MTHKIKSFATALVLLLSASAFAGNLSDYQNVRDLLNSDNVVLYSYWGCLEDGYSLNQSEYNPIYYLVQPEGEHVAGTVKLTLNRSQGNNSLTTDYIFIEVEIIDDSNGNLKVGQMTVKRSTVY